METSKRKREISSCIPCYTKKQKCNRRYPCDHCTRRRRPELCAYYPSQATLSPGRRGAINSRDGLNCLTSQPPSALSTSVSLTSTPFPLEATELSSVAGLFGYCEGSKSNTLALVQKLGISTEGRDISLPAEVIPNIQNALGNIPSRPILDSLLQYFVAEVNWLNSIKGVSLAGIREACTSVADVLESICSQLDERGSLIRVQHLAFAGLGFLFQGQMNNFWASLSSGARVAQRIGLHLETSLWDNPTDQFDKEMGRRTFCSLYVLDSVLSFRMDHISLFPHYLKAGNMPQMHLVPEAENSADAPDVFAERILQVKLVHFWKRQSLTTGPEYDVLEAQERYDKFIAEFLPDLPPVFSLEPDTQWDSRLPKLCLQRQILHMAIFDSICYNFRAVLLQNPSQIELLPGYKQVLLSSHKKVLASAALKVLECGSTLHDMMGGSHNRYPGMVIPTFEAAVPLLWLCAESNFPGDTMDVSLTTGTLHPLSTVMAHLSRHACMQAAKGAVDRLQVLAELSKPAEVGARALAFLIARIEYSATQCQQQNNSIEAEDNTIQMVEAWKGKQVEDISSIFTMSDMLCGTNTLVGYVVAYHRINVAKVFLEAQQIATSSKHDYESGILGSRQPSAVGRRVTAVHRQPLMKLFGVHALREIRAVIHLATFGPESSDARIYSAFAPHRAKAHMRSVEFDNGDIKSNRP
ncbi:hypothetical protein CHU98_g5136 [Xylaria longipes]|nr:hypothetical protein CHU98_g5136 [Xylaria longipes]